MIRKNHTTTLYRALLALALLTISYLALTSQDIPVVDDLNDKVSHMAAFFALSLLVDLSWPLTSFVSVKLPGLVGYGALIEVVQHFLPRRSASVLDLAADGVGILLYLLAAAPLARKLGLLIDRSRA